MAGNPATILRNIS